MLPQAECTHSQTHDQEKRVTVCLQAGKSIKQIGDAATGRRRVLFGRKMKEAEDRRRDCIDAAIHCIAADGDYVGVHAAVFSFQWQPTCKAEGLWVSERRKAVGRDSEPDHVLLFCVGRRLCHHHDLLD